MRINSKGFTLLELLVVIAIISLLSTLAVIALGSAREKARDSKRISDLREVQSALEYYYLEHNEYPIAQSALPLGGSQSSCLNSQGFSQTNCASPFMAQLPIDPSGIAYIYTSAADGSSYTIQATLEGELQGLQGTIVATPREIAVQP